MTADELEAAVVALQRRLGEVADVATLALRVTGIETGLQQLGESIDQNRREVNTSQAAMDQRGRDLESATQRAEALARRP